MVTPVTTVAGVTEVGVFGVNTSTAFADVAVPSVIFGASLVKDVYAFIAVPAEAEPTDMAVPNVGVEPTSVTFGMENAVPAEAEPTVMGVSMVGAEPSVITSVSFVTLAVVGEPAAVTLGTVTSVTLMFGTVNGVPSVGVEPTFVTFGMFLLVTLIFGISVVVPPVTTELAVDVMFGMLILVVVRLAAVPAETVAAAPVVGVIVCVCPFLLKMFSAIRGSS